MSHRTVFSFADLQIRAIRKLAMEKLLWSYWMAVPSEEMQLCWSLKIFLCSVWELSIQTIFFACYHQNVPDWKLQLLLHHILPSYKKLIPLFIVDASFKASSWLLVVLMWKFCSLKWGWMKKRIFLNKTSRESAKNLEISVTTILIRTIRWLISLIMLYLAFY